jgi:hypothetical protein
MEFVRKTENKEGRRIREENKQVGLFVGAYESEFKVPQVVDPILL